MNELITKEALEEMGFAKYDHELTAGEGYRIDQFRVIIYEADLENPKIAIVLRDQGNIPVWLEGAYTLKDLRDVMFFRLGEKGYSELFGHLPMLIVEETKLGYSKEEMMLAFDEGFLSNDPAISHYPNFTSEQWYVKKYGK